MPAYHIPTQVSVPIDEFLLDEEFDIFEITPERSRKSGMVRAILICDEKSWDEFDDDMEAM